MFAVAIWDARARPARARARPVRDQAALLPRRSAASSPSPPSSTRCPSGELDLDALEAFLATNVVPAPLSIFREIRKLPAGPHADLGASGGGRARALRAAGPAAGRAPTTRPSSSRSAARACATRCARTSSPTCRSGCCSRAASTRARSTALAARGELRAACAPSRSGSRSSRSTSSPARARSPSRYGTRHRELVLRPDAGAAAAGARRRLRRAVRRLLGAADLPRLPARRRGRQGDALGRGRRRALRRLLHLRRRPARRARRPGGGLAAAGWSSGCPRRRAGSASTTAPSASPRAAHLPPLERHRGLEGDLLGRGPRRAAPAGGTASTRSSSSGRASPRPRATSC